VIDGRVAPVYRGPPYSNSLESTMFRTRVTALVLAAVLLGGVNSADADLIFYGPTPYLSAADSPFAGGTFSYFYRENFEGGSLSTPGVAASAGWSVFAPGQFTDSVDADDGVIDGSGTGGHSFFSNFSTNTLTFTFSAGGLGGQLPTDAGIVWTDVGQNNINDTIGLKPVTFSAVNGLGASLGSIGPFIVGDGVITGTTAEDRFFGVHNSAGISSITITMPNSNNWEVDHLQYGFSPSAVPEPTSWALLSVGLIGGVVWRRIRRRA